MMPKMTAPIGRAARATVSVSAMSGRVRPNDFAMSSMTSVRMKKSNASSVQPRKPASTAFRWLARSALVIVGTWTAVAMVREGYYGNRRGRGGRRALIFSAASAQRAGHWRAKARLRGLSSYQREMRRAGGEESDGPGVVIQRLQYRHDEAAPGQRAADRGGANRPHVPAAIDTVRQIEVFKAKLASPDDPVVGDQDAGNRPEPARVAEQPRVDVARRIGQKLPRLNHDAEDAGNEPAGLEADQAWEGVGEVVGGRHDVGGDVHGNRGDDDGEHRDRDDDR